MITWGATTLAPTTVISTLFSGVVWLLKTRSEKKITAKIEHEFDKKLEKYKAELQEKAAGYQNDIQQKFEIFKTVTSQIQDRRTRSNEKEYNACIEVWNSLHKSFISTRTMLSSSGYITDFSKISKDESKIILKELNFSPHDINHILEQKDIQTAFFKILKAKKLKKSATDIYRAKITLSENSIFFNEDLYNKCIDFLKILSSSHSEQEALFYDPHNASTELPNAMRIIRAGEEILDGIRISFRKNLYIRAVDFTAQSQHDEVKPSPAPQPSPPDNTPEPEPTAPK